MTVPIVDTTPGAEGAANRLGALAYALEVLNAARDPDTAGSWAETLDDVFGLFVGVTPDLNALVAPLTTARTAGERGLDVVAKAIRTAAEQVLIKMFDDDSALPSRTLAEALNAFLARMKSGAFYFDANTLGATATQTSLAGTGLAIVSYLDGAGYPLENLLAETLKIRVLDNSLAGAETLQVLGEAAESDKLARRWPRGSGSNARYTSIAAGSDGVLTNGTFETFTVANTPDDWTLGPGAAGTDFLKEDTIIYEGAHALAIVGDGSTLPGLKQELDDLAAKSPYAIVVALRMNSAPSTGVLTIDLYDGTNPINDEAGNANSVTVDLTTLGTSYVLKTLVARLPDPVPAAVWLRLRTTTAIETAKILYVDSIRLVPLAQPSAALGNVPFIGFASGAVAWSGDDGDPTGTTVFQIATTNNRASKWATYLDRLFDIGGRGLRFPTSGSTLVNDSLI